MIAGQIGGHEGTRTGNIKKKPVNVCLTGIGEVVEQGPGVTNPAIGSKVGIKWAAEVCLNCGA